MKIFKNFFGIILCLPLSIQAQDVKVQKEMYSSQNEMDSETIVPVLLDRFIEYVEVHDMDKLWNMIDKEVQEIQSKEDIIKIFGIYNKYFGKIVSYRRIACNKSYGQWNVLYDIDFGKYKGKAEGGFKVYDKRTAKMVWFKLTLKDYTFVEALDSIARPTIEAIMAKDKKQIYELTSAQFNQYSSIDEILEIDITEIIMIRHQFGINDGNEVVKINYELNDKAAYLQFSFKKQNNIFKLDGFNSIILKK